MITIENDGKGKHQSFTAKYEEDDEQWTGLGASRNPLEVSGYGADEAEARAYLRHEIERMIVKLNDVLTELGAQG